MSDSETVNEKYVQWKTRHGVRYLDISFSETNDVDALDVMMRVIDAIKYEKENSIRVITNISHMTVSFNTHKTIRTMSKMYQRFVYKSAFIGMSSSIEPFYKLYKMFTGSKSVVFSSKKEALDYIIG